MLNHVSLVRRTANMTLLTSLGVMSPQLHADTIKYQIETKAHYRDSEAVSFPVNFPPDTFLTTVNEGGHVELSNIAAQLRWQLSENIRLIGKVDFINLHERNPTSSDNQVDIDTFILRSGTKHADGPLPETWSSYIQMGKFGKFERQEDRHLESYGLMSTSFNRLEDAGFEAGLDLTNGLYGKLSYTVGTPLFFRDPNALAGDNGVFTDVDEDIQSGFPILYDAEIEDVDFSEHPETGLGLGYRWLSEDGLHRLNIMAFHYQRELSETIKLHGSVYGGDLDLLVIEPNELPPGTISAPVGLSLEGNDKTEHGLNIWWYGNRATAFFQYVSQDVAGLERAGSELELSYGFGDIWTLQRISPTIRWSELRCKFSGPALFPAPSIWWDWEKIDVGVNVDFNADWRLTLEHSFTNFVRGGKTQNNNELLATLRWQWGN